jgi:membrane protease YdiL (CAAX protease family)
MSQAHTDSSNPAEVNWTAVLVYFSIACGLSWPLMWWSLTENWTRTAIPLCPRWMAVMWGPGIAALVCFVLFRKNHRRTITFWGSSKTLSALFYLFPMLLLAFTDPPAGRLLLAIFRNPEAHQVTSGLFLLDVVVRFCRTLGEELGWRGFLQDALRPMRFVPRFLSIGVLWEFWHLIFRMDHLSLGQLVVVLAISYPAAILLSFIIGVAVERSRSLCVAVSLHAWINLANDVPTRGVFVVLGISILFWIFLLWRWPQPSKNPVPIAVPTTGGAGFLLPH